jgi:hypothetical protein
MASRQAFTKKYYVKYANFRLAEGKGDLIFLLINLPMLSACTRTSKWQAIGNRGFSPILQIQSINKKRLAYTLAGKAEVS